MTLTANKVMAAVFWDVPVIIHVDYAEKDKIINEEHYVNLLVSFYYAVKEIVRKWQKKAPCVRIWQPWQNSLHRHSPNSSD